MAPSAKEKKAKRLLKKLLIEQQYGTYARIFDEFDLYLTSDKGVVGYMEPDKGTITLNSGLDMDQISVVVRHEILHEYLQHTKRLLKKLNAPSLNIFDYKDNVNNLSIKDLIDIGYNPDAANFAGDYEISNRGYTEEDKAVARAIKLNGDVLHGLVTEDDHPDWVDLTVEEMYDELMKEMQDDPTPDDIDDDRKDEPEIPKQKPFELPPDDDDDEDQDDEQPKYNGEDIDVVWIYGSFDETTGQFVDDDGNTVNYTDTYHGMI